MMLLTGFCFQYQCSCIRCSLLTESFIVCLKWSRGEREGERAGQHFSRDQNERKQRGTVALWMPCMTIRKKREQPENKPRLSAQWYSVH